MSSGQNPLHLLWLSLLGWVAFQGFVEVSIFEIQHKPKSIPKQAQKWIQQLFRWFQVLRQLHVPFVLHLFACMFLHVPFICMHIPVIVHSVPFMFLSCSFHWYAFPFMFLSYSFHVHSNVHSCPFIFLSFASMFLSYCIHVLSFPFYSHGNGLMAWPGNRVQQMVIAKLSLRLSLNKPSNIWHCSKKICHKTSKRERERKRVSELDAK